jgi:hypothetical protein
MIGQIFQLFAAKPCPGGGFLGFPTWYKYLPGTYTNKKYGGHLCSPQISGLNDVWLVLAAIIEILLQVAALLAVVMVIYGSINFIMSRGEPDKTANARNTIINALLGLAIAVIAAATVNFIAGSIH